MDYDDLEYSHLGHYYSDVSEESSESSDESEQSYKPMTIKPYLVQDLLYPIALHSHASALKNLCRVNKYGVNICNNQSFWLDYYHKHQFPIPETQPTTPHGWIKEVIKTENIIKEINGMIMTMEKSFDYNTQYTAVWLTYHFYYDLDLNDIIKNIPHITDNTSVRMTFRKRKYFSYDYDIHYTTQDGSAYAYMDLQQLKDYLYHIMYHGVQFQLIQKKLY